MVAGRWRKCGPCCRYQHGHAAACMHAKVGGRRRGLTLGDRCTQVKDQMVWMMLEERNKLHEEKRALQEQTESLQQEVLAKDRKIEALEVCHPPCSLPSAYLLLATPPTHAGADPQPVKA